MRRFLPAILLLALICAGWWRYSVEVRAARVAWQPLAGGGEVRLLAVTHGTLHQVPDPGPSLTARIGEAIRTRSMLPLRTQSRTGGMTSTGRPGIGVWLELRGAPQLLMPQEASLSLPGSRTFYTGGASGSTMGNKSHRMTSIFDYIPTRSKTLRYACKLGQQRFEFEFPNPTRRTDLPVWHGAPLPQTQQQGDLAFTLRAMQIQRGPNYQHHPAEEWEALPIQTITKGGEPADQWYNVSTTFEDPGGQSLRECGLFDEPVWKVCCTVTRTNNYPFHDEEVRWLGTAGPEAPPEQTTRLFTFDPESQPGGLKLGGVFGAGEYTYQNGAIVETSAPVKIDPQTQPKTREDSAQKKLHISLEKPAVVIFGSSMPVFRDAEGHPTRLEETWSHVGSLAGRVTIYQLPAAPVRIGTASRLESGSAKFEFYIPTPEKPGLKNPAKP